MEESGDGSEFQYGIPVDDNALKGGSTVEATIVHDDNESMLRTYGVVSVINLAIWVFMLTIVFIRADNVRFFTFPMTTRSTISPNSTAVAQAFAAWEAGPGGATADPATMYPFSEAHRPAARDAILALAHCTPVASAGGGYEWSQQAISPMCDCLDSIVAAKILGHVGGNVSRVHELEDLSSADIAAARASADPKAALEGSPPGVSWDACMLLSRATQVEELHDANGFWAVNVVYLTLTWCTVATMASVFVSGIPTNEGWLGWGRAVLYTTAIAPPIVVIVVLSITGGQMGCGVASGAVCVSVGIVMTLMIVYRERDEHDRDSPENDGQAIRNASMTSTCYAVGAWAAWASLNSSMQSRDHMYTMASGGIVVVVAFISYSVRYAYQVMVRFSEKQEMKNTFEAYTAFFSAAWYCNAAIVAGLLIVPGTGFVAGPFSNTGAVCLASTVIMFAYPILQRMHSTLPSTQSHGLSTVLRDTTTYLGVDLAARLLMVSAVATDLWSTGIADRPAT